MGAHTGQSYVTQSNSSNLKSYSGYNITQIHLPTLKKKLVKIIKIL